MWVRLTHTEALDKCTKARYNVPCMRIGKELGAPAGSTAWHPRDSVAMDMESLTECCTCTFELNKDAIIRFWMICGHSGVWDFVAN